MSLMDDVLRTIDHIRDTALRPVATFHHPDCPAVDAQDAYACTCGGLAYPADAGAGSG